MSLLGYRQKVCKLSSTYSYYGDIWWCGLVAEMNATKSKTYHRIIKGLPPKRFGFLQALWMGMRRYLSFAAKWASRVWKVGIDVEGFTPETFNLVFRYKKESLGNLENQCSKSVLTLDDSIFYFLSWTDFFYVTFHWVLWLFRPSPNLGEEYKEDIMRSFKGDVLVDTLFYRRIFKRLRKVSMAREVYYPYEGLAWEKSMLLWFGQGIHSNGVMLSFPAEGILNYVSEFPRPDTLFLMGKIPAMYMRSEFKDVRTYVSSRYRYLKDVNSRQTEPTYTAILLSHDPEVSSEMIDWVNAFVYDRDCVVVKAHPDLKLNKGNLQLLGRVIGFEVIDAPLKNILPLCGQVIVHDSSSMIEAKAYGCEVVIPNLPSFVNMAPYVDKSKLFDVKDYVA